MMYADLNKDKAGPFLVFEVQSHPLETCGSVVRVLSQLS